MNGREIYNEILQNKQNKLLGNWDILDNGNLSITGQTNGSIVMFDETVGLIGEFEITWTAKQLSAGGYIFSNLCPVLRYTPVDTGIEGGGNNWALLTYICSYGGIVGTLNTRTQDGVTRESRGNGTLVKDTVYTFKLVRANSFYTLYQDDVIICQAPDPEPNTPLYLGWYFWYGGSSSSYQTNFELISYNAEFSYFYQKPTLTLSQNNNTLTATVSVDERLDDKSVRYVWDTGDATQSINISQTGTYSCTVTDSVGNSTTKSIYAEYVEPIRAPTVTISRSGYVLTANTTVDERLEDKTITYLWSTGDTTKSIGVSVSGTYSCTVTDSLGQTANDSYDITIEYYPVALISTNKQTCKSGENVTLSGCFSYCTDSYITSYLWSTGDTTESIEVTPENTTRYSLTVTAANGRSSTASIIINVETGEIELMKYLPQYWHENAEMKQIQKNTLNYSLYNLHNASNVITTEAYVGTSNNSRLTEWEHDLGITSYGTIAERRENVLSFFKRKGKLNEEVIKLIVNNFANGAECRVEFIPSVIRVLVRPRSESETAFPKVESILNAKKPAHLGLNVERFYCTWGEVKDNFETWNSVKNKGTWNDVRLFLPD